MHVVNGWYIFIISSLQNAQFYLMSLKGYRLRTHIEIYV